MNLSGNWVWTNENLKTFLIVFQTTLKKKNCQFKHHKEKVLTFATKKVDVAMIGADAYRTVCKLKRAQVFAISIKDLKYQAEKKARPKPIQKVLYQKNIKIF